MKTYLLTGASSGIGLAIAHKLASVDTSNRVILQGRDADRMERVRLELPHPENHSVLIADLSDHEGLARAIQVAGLEKENLVAVIANAGVGGENHYGAEDRWSEILDTNLGGTYHLIQNCLPALKKSKESYKNIVIVSSVLSRLGVPKYSAYCASKAGLLGLTRSFAAEFASEKILVNAICPGWVDTRMAREGLEQMGSTREIELAKVPLGKMSEPREIAELVHFLVSGVQTSITGQTIDINNGLLMP